MAMAPEQSDQKKTRRLKAPSQTVREQAENQGKPKRPSRARRVSSKAGGPVRKAGRGLKKVFRPFRFLRRPLRFLGKILGFRYVASSWRELRQVTWPDRKTTAKLTGAVLIFSVVFGVIIAIVDFGLDKLFRLLLTQS
ncbi:MAG: secE [Candidatus Saccharibacteria bacterium]|nr:secE [Candidatus Saccharibacteria bacterium]